MSEATSVAPVVEYLNQVSMAVVPFEWHLYDYLCIMYIIQIEAVSSI